MTNFKVGDTVFFIDEWLGAVEAEIIDIMFSGRVAKVKILIDRSVRQLYTEKLFSSIEGILEEFRKIKDEYKKEIVDLKSLLQFMLDTDMNTCEYGDTNARQAAIERSMELFGIELE